MPPFYSLSDSVTFRIQGSLRYKRADSPGLLYMWLNSPKQSTVVEYIEPGEQSILGIVCSHVLSENIRELGSGISYL